MNDVLYQRALDALRDPALLERLDAEFTSRREQLQAFKTSHTFQSMCDCLRGSAVALSVDSDECSYRREDVAARIGWGNISEQDVNHFFSIMASSTDTDGDQNDVAVDEDIPFENESFIKYGLHVFCMQGQGSFIRVSNLVNKVIT